MFGCDYKIVVVDNGSPNDSGDRLKAFADGSDDLVVISADKNLGFAKGNNLGYRYAKSKYSPNYIFVMNNDVFLETENVESILEKIFSETKFDVLGPDIYLASGLHQNPSSVDDTWNKEETKKLIKHFRKILFFYPFWFFGNAITKIKKKLFFAKRLNATDATLPIRELSVGRRENAHLFGACYILSKSFIQKEEKVFDERTFMYCEESIFTYQNRKKGSKIIYDDQIKVKHMHGAATRQAARGSFKKMHKMLKRTLDSLKIYLEVLEENGD